MKLVLLEDDEMQSDEFETILRTAFADITIQVLATELEFREWLEGLDSDVPDLVVLDVMVRWTDPGPDQREAPPEVREAGFFAAGLRCIDLLAKEPRTARVPVILYSMLEAGDLGRAVDDLPPHVAYVAKEIDDRRLLRTVRALTQTRQESA